MKRFRVRRKRKSPFLIIIILLLMVLFGTATVRVRKVFMEFAVNICEDTALHTINELMQERIFSNRETYENLVILERDNENHVTALQTDVIAIGQIKTQIANGLFEELEYLEETGLEISLGSVFAPNYFSGRGPKIKIGMNSLIQAYAEFVSSFSAAGINQTRHNIIIEVHAGFRILTPFGAEDHEIVTSYPVTDTVIVGTVPEQYTYIDDTRENLLEKINDYEINK